MKKRPLAVTFLAIIAVVAGIVSAYDALRLLGLFPVAQFGQLQFFGGSILGAAMAGLVAVIWFGVARQLWNLDPRGWLFVVVIAVAFLIFDLVEILSGSTVQAVLPSVLINAVALILALLPGTKEAFGEG